MKKKRQKISATMRRATRSRRPLHSPFSISMHTLSPEGEISQSVEDFAKAWSELNERCTLCFIPHEGQMIELTNGVILVKVS